ncbi:hypothetical protein SAY86_009144 [Trapa natans]|uniref:Uncharacterized protein n=1 Tax=Trapa natans TaxID=22666 RepID=A0AAN7KAS9_TRANT|nr:hypothetical protein SAY86_009144 [Trapa natans]
MELGSCTESDVWTYTPRKTLVIAHFPNINIQSSQLRCRFISCPSDNRVSCEQDRAQGTGFGFRERQIKVQKSPKTTGEGKMVRLASGLAMCVGAFLFWSTMDHLHVWIALHQDEKVRASLPTHFPPFLSYSSPTTSEIPYFVSSLAFGELRVGRSCSASPIWNSVSLPVNTNQLTLSVLVRIDEQLGDGPSFRTIADTKRMA